MKISRGWMALTVLMVSFQLLVPVKMIFDRETVLKQGKLFKFAAAPVDPYDPFSGRYVALAFKHNFINSPDAGDWQYNEKGYVLLREEADGYTRPAGLSREKPVSGDYLPVQFSYWNLENKQMILRYSFDRFYMDELKAPKAEQAYRDQIKETDNVYAAVKVFKGRPVVENLFVNDLPVRDYLAKDPR